MTMRIRVTPAVVSCPRCGLTNLGFQRIDHPEMFEYRARCPHCGWKCLFRELFCEKCSRNWIFIQTPEGWQCCRCRKYQKDLLHKVMMPTNPYAGA